MRMEPKYKLPNISVIGPGGIKILQALGFLLHLEEQQFLGQIKIYSGVSAGAIVSLMIVCGYSVPEIIEEGMVANIFYNMAPIDWSQALSKRGLLSNQTIKDMLSEKVMNKFGFVPSLSRL